MQRAAQADPLSRLVAAAHHLQIGGGGAALLVVQEAGTLVAHPGVGAAPARIHPQHVPEAQVVPQGGVQDADGDGDELPAAQADISLIAARAHVIVVSQVDVEDQLLGQRPEGSLSQRLAVARVGAVHGADLEAARVQAQDVTAQGLERRERLVAQVGVVLQREGELAVAKVVARHGRVVQPLKELSPGEQPLVEGVHHLRVRVAGAAALRGPDSAVSLLSPAGVMVTDIATAASMSASSAISP